MVVKDSASAHSTESTMPAAVPASGGQPYFTARIAAV